MILILSQDYDLTTEDVIDWLMHYNIPFMRLNGSHLFSSDYLNFAVTLQKSNLYIELNLDFADVRTVWFRRWQSESSLEKNKPKGLQRNIEFQKNSSRDKAVINNLFFDTLKSKKWVSSPKTSTLNKIDV